MQTLTIVVTLATLATLAQFSQAEESTVPRGLRRRALKYHHCSTALEGALRGWADYISAVGEHLVNRSTAGYIDQQARGLAIDVEQQRIHARWRLQDAYADRNFPRDQVDRKMLAVLNHRRLPARLPLRTFTGAAATIHWPAALQGDAFAPHRKALEHALALRAGGEFGSASVARLEATSARDETLAALRDRVADIPPMQYVAARRFVESLAYETMFPAGNQGEGQLSSR